MAGDPSIGSSAAPELVEVTTDRPAWERPNMNGRCTHLDRIRDVKPSSWGCEDCLGQGR